MQVRMIIKKVKLLEIFILKNKIIKFLKFFYGAIGE